MDTSLALLSLGSNVEPLPHLQHAVAALRGRFGPLRVSPAYRTPAVGFDGPDFLNAAVALHTDLSLDALEGAANARIRFRFTSDVSQVYDGWNIDDIRIVGAGPVCGAAPADPVFANGFE